jgi:hypothetical protein
VAEPTARTLGGGAPVARRLGGRAIAATALTGEGDTAWRPTVRRGATDGTRSDSCST